MWGDSEWQWFIFNDKTRFVCEGTVVSLHLDGRFIYVGVWRVVDVLDIIYIIDVNILSTGSETKSI